MDLQVAQFLDEIDELLEDSKYSWAEETLRGISATIHSTGMVTENQRTAIQNIIKNNRIVVLSDKYRSSRRYECWTPPTKQ
jgi:hypothetical protein